MESPGGSCLGPKLSKRKGRAAPPRSRHVFWLLILSFQSCYRILSAAHSCGEPHGADAKVRSLGSPLRGWWRRRKDRSIGKEKLRFVLQRLRLGVGAWRWRHRRKFKAGAAPVEAFWWLFGRLRPILEWQWRWGNWSGTLQSWRSRQPGLWRKGQSRWLLGIDSNLRPHRVCRSAGGLVVKGDLSARLQPRRGEVATLGGSVSSLLR